MCWIKKEKEKEEIEIEMDWGRETERDNTIYKKFKKYNYLLVVVVVLQWSISIIKLHMIKNIRGIINRKSCLVCMYDNSTIVSPVPSAMLTNTFFKYFSSPLSHPPAL